MADPGRVCLIYPLVDAALDRRFHIPCHFKTGRCSLPVPLQILWKSTICNAVIPDPASTLTLGSSTGPDGATSVHYRQPKPAPNLSVHPICLIPMPGFVLLWERDRACSCKGQERGNHRRKGAVQLPHASSPWCQLYRACTNERLKQEKDHTARLGSSLSTIMLEGNRVEFSCG